MAKHLKAILFWYLTGELFFWMLNTMTNDVLVTGNGMDAQMGKGLQTIGLVMSVLLIQSVVVLREFYVSRRKLKSSLSISGKELT